MWDLVLRLGGQVRVASGLGGGRALGYDMASALALAGAMNIPPAAVAEFLPIIERAAIAAINEASSE